MQRRTFIGGGAAALAVAATAACNGKDSGGKASGATDTADTSLRTATTGTGTTSTGTGTSTTRAAANWTALAKDLDGALVRPGDRSWSVAHQLYNTRFDSLKPTAVAYVAHADDIRTTMAYARAHNIPLSIRNGGHSYAGWSSGNGRLILDVSKLNTIRASANEAVIGAGSKLIDVYRALTAKGVTIPAGSCPTVGVSGLTLGGGHGVVSRAYGLTCDSLTQATLITADGKQLVANASENKDLFWALRGAGNGNFGVVTELRFKTHPAPQAVSAYMTWPWAKAAAVVKAWQEWGPDQPDEIWSALHLENGSGTPTVAVAAFSSAPTANSRTPWTAWPPRSAPPRAASRSESTRTTRRWRRTRAAPRSPPRPSATCRARRRAVPRRAPSAVRRTRPARTSSTARSPRPASRRC